MCINRSQGYTSNRWCTRFILIVSMRSPLLSNAGKKVHCLLTHQMCGEKW